MRLPVKMSWPEQSTESRLAISLACTAAGVPEVPHLTLTKTMEGKESTNHDTSSFCLQECQKYLTSPESLAGASACATIDVSSNLCPQACVDWVTVSLKSPSLVLVARTFLFITHQVSCALGGWVFLSVSAWEGGKKNVSCVGPPAPRPVTWAACATMIGRCHQLPGGPGGLTRALTHLTSRRVPPLALVHSVCGRQLPGVPGHRPEHH